MKLRQFMIRNLNSIHLKSGEHLFSYIITEKFYEFSGIWQKQEIQWKLNILSLSNSSTNWFEQYIPFTHFSNYYR